MEKVQFSNDEWAKEKSRDSAAAAAAGFFTQSPSSHSPPPPPGLWKMAARFTLIWAQSQTFSEDDVDDVPLFGSSLPPSNGRTTTLLSLSLSLSLSLLRMRRIFPNCRRPRGRLEIFIYIVRIERNMCSIRVHSFAYPNA